MKRILIWPLKLIFSIYALGVFISYLFLAFPIVLIAATLGQPLSGNIVYRLCQWWADTFFMLTGVLHRNIFEAPHDRQKQYVFVFNHISFMDIPVIMKTIRKQHFRILGRSDLAKIPIFGLLYRLAVVTVDRSNPANRARSIQELKRVIATGISVVIAPEGTFNTTRQPLKSFYDGAFKVAIETQTPIKPILFLDTYDRFNYKSLLSFTPGKSRAVYLNEISVEGLTLNDLPALKEKVFHQMAEKLKYYQASWIKENDTNNR
ncbi:MAG: hypothetical protein RLY16_49 [Bacteroidota bacterium]|jgi:1-acyl-sn-glycerol-3-phosphate acyltransferase